MTDLKALFERCPAFGVECQYVSEINRIEALTAENERLRSVLRCIEIFGHSDGHGRGYTCANMAEEALKNA